MEEESTIHQIEGGTLEILGDGTKIQKKGGVTIVVKPDGTKIQTSADSVRLTQFPDGTTFQEQPNGTTLHTAVDGTLTQERPDGIVFKSFPDGSKRQTDVYGIIVDIAANGDKIQTNLDGTKLETRSNNRTFRHLADGAIIEIDSSTGAILRIERQSGSAGAANAVAEADATKKQQLEEKKLSWRDDPNLTRHRSDDNGGWYEHNSLTGQTRWLTVEESEEQIRTDEVARSFAAMRAAEAKADELEMKSKQALESILSKLNDKISMCNDYENEVVELKAETARRELVHQSQIVALQSQLTLSNSSTMSGTDARVQYCDLQIAHEQTTAELAQTKGMLDAATKRLKKTLSEYRTTKQQLSETVDAKRSMANKYEEIVDRAGTLAEEMTELSTASETSAALHTKSLREIKQLEAQVAKMVEEKESGGGGGGGGGSGDAGGGGGGGENLQQKLVAAERMCEVTMKKLTSAQQEISQQKYLFDEMQARRESSDKLMRSQRTALRNCEAEVARLRISLQQEAARHAAESQAEILHAENLKRKLQTTTLAGTMEVQSERLYELTTRMEQKDELIAELRGEIATLHSQVVDGKRNAKRQQEEIGGNTIALEAMSFFDMDSLGLNKASPAPPPERTLPVSLRSGSGGRQHRRSQLSGRSSSMIFAVDQDNVNCLLSLREESRKKRSSKLLRLLSSHEEVDER